MFDETPFNRQLFLARAVLVILRVVPIVFLLLLIGSIVYVVGKYFLANDPSGLVPLIIGCITGFVILGGFHLYGKCKAIVENAKIEAKYDSEQ